MLALQITHAYSIPRPLLHTLTPTHTPWMVSLQIIHFAVLTHRQDLNWLGVGWADDPTSTSMAPSDAVIGYLSEAGSWRVAPFRMTSQDAAGVVEDPSAALAGASVLQYGQSVGPPAGTTARR